jgi:hypothetical protein
MSAIDRETVSTIVDNLGHAAADITSAYDTLVETLFLELGNERQRRMEAEAGMAAACKWIDGEQAEPMVAVSSMRKHLDLWEFEGNHGVAPKEYK